MSYLKHCSKTISNKVYVFEAVRNSDHVVTDFRNLVGDKAEHTGNGKLEVKLFDEFVNENETGESLNMIFQHQQNGQNRWYHVKAKKFNNGLIIYQRRHHECKTGRRKLCS